MIKVLDKIILFSLCVLGTLIYQTSCDMEKEKPNKSGLPPPPVILPPLPPAPPSLPGQVSLDRMESDMLAYLYSVQAEDRLNTRFLNTCSKLNEGENLKPFIQAVDKTLNSLSTERDLVSAVGADPQNCLRSFDLRDFAITSREWEYIGANDPFKLVSNTARGQLIQQLTQTRQPWFHADNFANITLAANVYYATVGVPSTLQSFYQFVGVNLQQAFDQVDRDLYLAGKTNSPISLQKPRLMLRADSRDGAIYATYDTDLNGSRANLFENPFPVEARSAKTFVHDAQEFIWHLPNQMLGWALFAANGARQDFAPLTTVVDVNAGGLDPTIRAARSCSRCHSNGLIVWEDEILIKIVGDPRRGIPANPNFDVADRQRAQAFYGNNGLTAALQKDNKIFCDAQQRLGISCNDKDPINISIDDFLNEWDLGQYAGFLMLTKDQLTTCIQSSLQGSNQIGQILAGSTVQLETIIAVTPVLIRDCNLFNDDLGD
jgi:hypothetical protein